MLNIAFGWLWITMGFLSGAMLGLGFHKENFMGGYGSWERRLARLGHIAFFGTGILNVLLGLTLMGIRPDAAPTPGWQVVVEMLFLIGGIGMPICCFVAAKIKRFRHAFVVPALALLLGGALLCVSLVLNPMIFILFGGGNWS